MTQQLKPNLTYTHLSTPLGDLLLAGLNDRLHLISFPIGSKAVSPFSGWRHDKNSFPAIRDQLLAYFEGSSGKFDFDAAPGGTEFQRVVWAALCEIPYGTTVSYAEIARRIGRPNAVRAVGAANGSNPLPIIVPCHRVIGSSGTLTGFGGGLEAKRYLLDHELKRSLPIPVSQAITRV